jgi:2-polyprenyl-3-methyl-5-hydroxy-6-metoxy-1,4-benzoquinol methylase
VRLFDPDRVEGGAMAIREQAWPALDDTRAAFDRVAAGYDQSNTENPILSAMRQRTLAALTSRVSPGARILDLGCGPGGDAETLARAGYSVTAVDWSPAMVEEAQRRVREAQVRERVSVRHLGIQEIDHLEACAYHAALSNFGPLNCVPDLDEAARLIAGRLRPGGVLVASVIGRVCPWEIGLYVARGQVSRARVRFAKAFVPVPLDGKVVWTRYYSPRRFERAFSRAGFRRTALRGLGVFAPPPYLESFARRHRRLVNALEAVDDRVAGWPLLRGCGDHFLMVLVKR